MSDIADKLVQELPYYIEGNNNGKFMHEARLYPAWCYDIIRKAERLDSSLENLPVVQLAEIYWNDPKRGKTIAYVAGIIMDADSIISADEEDLFLVFSSSAINSDSDANLPLIPVRGSELEKINTIRDYKPLEKV